MHPGQARRLRHERAAAEDRELSVGVRGETVGRLIPIANRYGLGWYPVDLAGHAVSELPYADSIQAELCLVRHVKKG